MRITIQTNLLIKLNQVDQLIIFYIIKRAILFYILLTEIQYTIDRIF
jgi:hypothetical protein